MSQSVIAIIPIVISHVHLRAYMYTDTTAEQNEQHRMAERQHRHSKQVERLPAVVLRLVERWNEVGLIHREHPVVTQDEPHKKEQAEDNVDIVLVGILSPWILVSIIVANDDRLGD